MSKTNGSKIESGSGANASTRHRGWWVGLIALALALATFPVTAVAQDDGTKSLEVDPVHSNVLVRAKHLGAGFNFLEFTDVSGTVEFNQEEPSKSAVNLTVKTASVDSGVEKRDNHLKGPDFFHAKQYPEMTFESKNVEKAGEKTYEVTGDLTIRDKTKEITIEVQHLGEGKDQDGNTRYGFYTEFEIDRTEFGVSWKPDAGIVGKTIRLIIALEGVDK